MAKYKMALINSDDDKSHISNEEVNMIFNDVIGQEKVVNKIKFFVQSHNKNISIPNFLFTGSHGLGKTYLAEKIAKSLGRKFVSVNASTIENIGTFLFSDIMGDKEVTVLIDEAQTLKKNISNMLLTLLNPNGSNSNSLVYNDIEVVLDLNKINFIFATTDAYMIDKPLVNRCNIINFESYNDDDIINMLKYYLGRDVFYSDVSKEDIALACRGRARDTFLFAKNIQRYMVLNNIDYVGKNTWEDIKKMLGINPMGLTDFEFKLLRVIHQHGPISCNSLSCILMVNEYNIKNEIEVRLRELGLIENNTKGRVLTSKGLKVVENLMYSWFV